MVWLDGQVTDAVLARVGALDRGFTVGDGVFETCAVRDGHPFALTRHLRRLERSARLLGLACPTPDVVRTAVAELVLAATPAPRARLRITLTAGPGPIGSGRGDAPPTLMLAVAPASPWPAQIAVVTVGWARNEHSAVLGAKTTSYAENVVALAAARRQGAGEALLANTAGLLCEGTGSNVVVVLDGHLVTPTLSSGCLAGITRELFLEWAAKDGLPVVQRDQPLGVLTAADDVLLLSSTRDVQRVDVIDSRKPKGSDLGRAAVALFARRASEGLDP